MAEFIRSVWSIELVQQTLDRRSMSCIDLLKKAYNNTCVCQGEYRVHTVWKVREKSIKIRVGQGKSGKVRESQGKSWNFFL